MRLYSHDLDSHDLSGAPTREREIRLPALPAMMAAVSLALLFTLSLAVRTHARAPRAFDAVVAAIGR